MENSDQNFYRIFMKCKNAKTMQNLLSVKLVDPQIKKKKPSET